jgi:hypothetical protein
MLYIKTRAGSLYRAFSPIIIIEDLHLQTFVHTLKTAITKARKRATDRENKFLCAEFE